MAVTVSARLSTDSGNALSFGSDTGLYGALPNPVRGGAQAWTIDNSWGTAVGTSYYYYLGNLSVAASPTAGTAYIWPIVFSRAAKFTSLQLYVSTAGAGSSLYHSVYSSDTTGLPSAKLSDLGYGSTAATGVVNHTMTDTTTVWQPYTLYWVCSWINTSSASPTFYMRNIGTSSIRLSVAPTGVGWWSSTGALSLLDTTSGWTTRTTGPASLVIAANSTTAPGQSIYAPNLALGIANV